MLVSAILVALTIVSIVVLLNGVQFYERANAENSLQEVEHAEYVRRMVESDLRRLFARVDSTDPAAGRTRPRPYAAETLLEDEVGVYDDYHGKMVAAERPVHTSVSLVDSGSASPTDAGRAFTQADGSPFVGDASAAAGTGTNETWEVVENVEGIPAIHLQLTERNADRSDSDGTATLEIENDDGDVWRLQVQPRNVRIKPPGGSWRELCQSPGGGSNAFDSSGVTVGVVIEGGRGRVRPADPSVYCEPFTFGKDRNALDDAPPYDVRFVDGEEVTGNYTITTVSTGGIVVDANYGGDATSPNGDSEYPNEIRDVVVNPAFEFTYRGTDVGYATTFALYEVAP